MDDLDRELSRLLIMYHGGICLACVERKLRPPIGWIVNKIEEFRLVAPVKEFDDVCPECRARRHLYSIHYPLP